MPNWCFNYMTVTGPEADLLKFADSIVDDSGQQDALIFEKLLPMPENGIKPIVGEDGEDMGSAFANPENDGDEYIDGWAWTLTNWGTKWGDRDTVFEKTENGLTFKYETAWNPANYTIISRMFPELTFIIEYEEAGMGFLGCDVYQNGNHIRQEGEYPVLKEDATGEMDYDDHLVNIEEALEKAHERAVAQLI